MIYGSAAEFAVVCIGLRPAVSDKSDKSDRSDKSDEGGRYAQVARVRDSVIAPRTRDRRFVQPTALFRDRQPTTGNP